MLDVEMESTQKQERLWVEPGTFSIGYTCSDRHADLCRSPGGLFIIVDLKTRDSGCFLKDVDLSNH